MLRYFHFQKEKSSFLDLIILSFFLFIFLVNFIEPLMVDLSQTGLVPAYPFDPFFLKEIIPKG